MFNTINDLQQALAERGLAMSVFLTLEQQTLPVDIVSDTFSALLKHQEDIERLQGQTLDVAWRCRRHNWEQEAQNDRPSN